MNISRLLSRAPRVLIFLLASTASAQAPPPDNISLTVTAGPGAGEIQLDWTGGAPIYAVFRSTNPASVFDPAKLKGQTAASPWVETPPSDPFLFYLVINPPCVSGSDCATGSCVDGACCDTSCLGTCQACNLAGSIGTCANISSGQDPSNECAGTTTCNGAGACALYPNGQPCGLSTECQSGVCADGVCCSTTCTAPCKACDNPGSVGTCTNVFFQDPPRHGICPACGLCNTVGSCCTAVQCTFPNGICVQ